MMNLNLDVLMKGKWKGKLGLVCIFFEKNDVFL